MSSFTECFFEEMLRLGYGDYLRFSFEDKLVYYKLLFALAIRIDDDVGHGKREAGIGDTVDDYIEPEFCTRCERVYPNGIGSCEIIEALIHLLRIVSSASSIV